MPLLITGSVRADQVLDSKVPVNMREKIDILDSERAFFEHLSRQFNPIVPTDNLEFNFLEQRPYPNTMVCDEVTTSGDTEVHVDFPARAHRDQLIYNTRTQEHYLMNEDIGGVDAAGTITVVNLSGTGGTTLATEVGDILQIGPEAHADGEAIPPAYSTQPTKRFTFLFQHDKRRENTDRQRATKEYGTKQLMLDRKQFWVDEMKALAMLLYVGKQNLEVLSASGPRRYAMSGIMEQISTNVIDFDNVPGALTLASIGEIMRLTMDYSASSTTKVAVLGLNSWNSVSAMPASAIRTTVSETSWGKRLTTLVTPHGTLSIGYDRLLSAKYGMADKLFVLDPSFIERLELAGLKTHLMLNIENSTDIHNQIDVITGTDGIRLGLEELHAQAEHIN